jgi:hypothetical protein
MEGGYFCIIMKIKNIFLIGTAIIPLLPGCALTPVTLDSIGPAPENGKPSDYAPMGSGWLRVYTATKRHEIGDNTFFYSHTGYRICTKDGQLWKFIPKNTDNMDEAASIVEIPAGDYKFTWELIGKHQSALQPMKSYISRMDGRWVGKARSQITITNSRLMPAGMTTL